ncbi:MAG: hypothetical protein QM754_11505 [Tepidisphaeraceae bacterium]
MLSNPPPVYRKRHRPPERPFFAPPPPAMVTVVSVRVIDGTGSVWTFSGPVTVTLNVPCPQLRIFVDGEWLTGVNLGDWSENAVACDFDTASLAAGLAWEIVQTPAGLDFGPGVLALPQSGVLEEMMNAE